MAAKDFRRAADLAVASSAVCAVFGAALAYPSAAPTATAVAFVIGYGALLFLLPFSVFALEFLRPHRSLPQTPNSIVACAVGAPVALLAAVMAVHGSATGGGADDVAVAAGAVWAVDVAAAAALGWCLTNGGFTPVGLSRFQQYANFMEAMKRTPEIGNTLNLFIVGDRMALKRKAFRFVFAVSAACAVLGGAAVGAMSAGGVSSGATAAVVLFALPICLLYVPDFQMDPYPAVDGGVLKRHPAAPWCVLLAPVGLVLVRLTAAITTGMTRATAAARDVTFVAVAAAAAAVWAVDAVTAVLLGRNIARQIATPSRFGTTSSEMASAVLVVGVRYFLYLHVFHIIGYGGHHLAWFNPSVGVSHSHVKFMSTYATSTSRF